MTPTIKIEFQRDPTWEFIEPIVPATQALPQWYKDADVLMDWLTPEQKEHAEKDMLTFKGCPAILDSMVQGYILPLWVDILVEPTNEGPVFQWAEAARGVVQTQAEGSTTEFKPHQDKSSSPLTYKFNSPWVMRTPPEYSMLFIPPLNNQDSRFEPISGVICSDEFTTYINIPFMWKAPPDYRGIIKQGTPIAQMIPFKRETFQLDLGLFTDDNKALEDREKACSRKVASFLRGGYARFFQKTNVSK